MPLATALSPTRWIMSRSPSASPAAVSEGRELVQAQLSLRMAPTILSPPPASSTRGPDPARLARSGLVSTITVDVTSPAGVPGGGGVPATGVSAVALNVTVTEPTAPSYLTVFPSGSRCRWLPT